MQRLLCERWGTEFSTPESMIGTMVSVALPRSLENTELEARALQAAIERLAEAVAARVQRR